MKKILIICISLRAGGTERIVSILANQFARDHIVDLLLLSPNKSFYDLHPNVRIWQFSGKKSGLRRALYYPRAAHFIRQIIQTRCPDIVLSFGEYISSFVRIVTAGSGVKMFAFNRGSPYRSLRGISGWLNPLVFPFTEGVVVQTDKAKNILKNRYRFCRFHVIPNPVVIPPNVPTMRERNQVIVNVGMIGRLKNQEFLINAFATTNARADWKLLFVGDGPDRQRLESQVEKMGFSSSISFLGERKDVHQILSKAKVFAFTSLSEGFPNALAEALANGCACISFDCPTGPAELINNGENGFLVPMNDSDQYVFQLERLLEEEDLRCRFSEQARKNIQNFKFEKILSKFSNLIQEKSK